MTRESSIGAIIISVASFALGMWWSVPQDAVTQNEETELVDFDDSGPAASIEVGLAPTDALIDIGRVHIENLENQQFFPEAIIHSPGVVRVEDVRAADTNTLNKVEQRIWEASLSDLSEKERAELLEIRNRVGSIATPFIPGLDDIDVVEVRQEPHAFPISDDGSLVEILPSPFPTIQQVNNIQATSAIVEAAQNLYQQELLNQHTIGFKRSELIVTSPLTAGDFSPPEPVFIDETATKWLVRLDVSPGVNIETGNPLDIAIRGSGWLQVKLACGNLGYTRAGVLRLDKEQRLCIRTSGGLLPISPEIKLPPHASLEINATGTVSVSTPTGEPIESGTIQIFNFRDATLLQRLASGCYTANADTGKAYPVECQQGGQQTWIEAGHVEQSNAQVYLANKQLTQLQDLEQAIR